MHLKTKIRTFRLAIKVTLLTVIAVMYAAVLQHFIVSLITRFDMDINLVTLIFSLGLGFSLGIYFYAFFRFNLLFPHSHKHSNDFYCNSRRPEEWSYYFKFRNLQAEHSKLKNGNWRLENENADLREKLAACANEATKTITIKIS